MKRSELRVGEEYAYSTVKDWMSTKFEGPTRVRVVDVGEWRKEKGPRWGQGNRTVINTRGFSVTVWDIVNSRDCNANPNAVIVEKLHTNGTPYATPNLLCLTYGQIKALWSEAADMLAERDKERADATAARAMASERAKILFSRALGQLGVSGPTLVDPNSDTPKVTMGLLEFLEIADEYIKACDARLGAQT